MIRVWIDGQEWGRWEPVGLQADGATRDELPTQEDEMDTQEIPKANPPGFWPEQLAQECREAIAKLTRLADEFDAMAESERQASLAREAVGDGSYGGAR